MPMELSVQVAPVIIVRQSPRTSSSTATFMAVSELAQAASTTQFMPFKLKTLVQRPATTFPRKPGNESRRHSGKLSLYLWTMFCTSSSFIPTFRSTFSTTT